MSFNTTVFARDDLAVVADQNGNLRVVRTEDQHATALVVVLPVAPSGRFLLTKQLRVGYAGEVLGWGLLSVRRCVGAPPDAAAGDAVGKALGISRDAFSLTRLAMLSLDDTTLLFPATFYAAELRQEKAGPSVRAFTNSEICSLAATAGCVDAGLTLCATSLYAERRRAERRKQLWSAAVGLHEEKIGDEAG
ncbi:hypothetical protein F6X40_09460 [Paraburkholderia sp. UCT31]|uniref:hypothetical protein n=1 Tax=Paraburkholderia sp. UCT31 TaxID=2615209 RepID=UPI001654EEF9|nr:hypothetical protein [Paraburkholderia sp. UCT31]MBC8737035.1 hypothetical protein [Paraburkholderia sp. UCT31]